MSQKRNTAICLGFCTVVAACGDSTSPGPDLSSPFAVPDAFAYSEIGGGKLVFSRLGVGSHRNGVIIVDADARTAHGILSAAARNPVVAPDGKYLAYSGILGGGITMLELATNKRHTLTETSDVATFRDQEHVLFATQSSVCHLEIRQVPVTGSDANGSTIVNAAMDTPCFGSGGIFSATEDGRIVFAEVKGIYAIAEGESAVELIYPAGVGKQVVAPTWSPAGDRIAFVEVETTPADPAQHNAQLKVMTIDDGSTTTIADLEGVDNSVNQTIAWCGHGATIAYSARDALSAPGSLTSHIWLVNAAGGTPHQLTNVEGAVDEWISCTK